MKHYYYISKDSKGLLDLKHPIDDPNYIEITEEEFDSYCEQLFNKKRLN